jgi:hypothetical protein
MTAPVARELICLETAGPGGFVTWKFYQSSGGVALVWSSRHHRKGLAPPARTASDHCAEVEAIASTTLSCLWMPRRLNWWIGIVFAVGSLLFALGSVLCLWPALAADGSLDSEAINAIFFAGSIPFTLAAYLQLFQAANTPEFPRESTPASGRKLLIGWRPHDIGWLSAALQFVGTLLFNLNTFDAMIPSLTWFQQDLTIWVPNVIGSILFLVSGYLAFIETCHAWWRWELAQVSWWVTFINLLGCAGFMSSAVFAFVLPQPISIFGLDAVTLSIAFTLQGAVCFFLGAGLLLPETASELDVAGAR